MRKSLWAVQDRVWSNFVSTGTFSKADFSKEPFWASWFPCTEHSSDYSSLTPMEMWHANHPWNLLLRQTLRCLITMAFEWILGARKTEERQGNKEQNSVFFPLLTTCCGHITVSPGRSHTWVPCTQWAHRRVMWCVENRAHCGPLLKGKQPVSCSPWGVGGIHKIIEINQGASEMTEGIIISNGCLIIPTVLRASSLRGNQD